MSKRLIVLNLRLGVAFFIVALLMAAMALIWTVAYLQ
jgi:hypothetical protein